MSLRSVIPFDHPWNFRNPKSGATSVCLFFTLFMGPHPSILYFAAELPLFGYFFKGCWCKQYKYPEKIMTGSYWYKGGPGWGWTFKSVTHSDVSKPHTTYKSGSFPASSTQRQWWYEYDQGQYRSRVLYPRRCINICSARQLELQTMVREDFTITEKAPTKAYSKLKAASSGFHI